MSALKKLLPKSIFGEIRSLVRRAGFDINRYRPNTPETLLQDAFQGLVKLHKLKQQGTDDGCLFVDYCRINLAQSSSQIFQDLFVLHQLGEKRGGFFVEFGATNGVNLSNTYLLEKRYGWHGILAEPAKCWHESLKENRSCVIDFRCVWDKSGERLEFNEVANPELSTINEFTDTDDTHILARQNSKQYFVESISFCELLDQNKAPDCIDYLSIDTEGSELKILSAFDFKKYDIKVITVEHNQTQDREKIHSLLSSHGYVRKFENLSSWDDWYIKN